MNGFRDCINKMLDEKDEASLGNILNLFNKALRSHIFVCNVSCIACQTAGPNGLRFFEGTLKYPGGDIS